ncbi:hypothetical protein ZIOFF_051072 [Zingiber officinale]|uniref:Protein kinase domain-containing protein n=1 Tax=Zingiber officinale TaxID=94328 RepID=A0A8J5FLA0_ZINOF|nr:hypothetical protein ZIOFF_051072 [Zingiber officinale]
MAVSLIGKVIKAATDAQMMKKEFRELASYLELVGRQLEMLDGRELGDASMQTFQKMEEVLLQCHDLANSCQQRSSIYLMVKVEMAFNFETIIGRGGFGTVYYGLLEDGTDVAIKLRTQSTPQGDREFLAELRSLTQVCHNNLISLIGYCKDGSEAGFPALTWTQRLQIAYQAALGLNFLHTGCNPPIVHRDVKSSNILLDSNLEAKITDFGISKVWNENDTDETTVVVGTPGYLDPEYAVTCHFSDVNMENEEVEEAFVTSISQADRPLCMHQLSANLFTSWTENTPGRRWPAIVVISNGMTQCRKVSR